MQYESNTTKANKNEPNYSYVFLKYWEVKELMMLHLNFNKSTSCDRTGNESIN